MSNTPVPADIQRYLLNRLNAKAGFTLSLADVTFGNPILLDGTVLDFSNPALRNSEVAVSAASTPEHPAVNLTLRYNRLDLTKLFTNRSKTFSADLGSDLADFIDAISDRVGTVVSVEDFDPQVVDGDLNRLSLVAASTSLRVIGAIDLIVGEAVEPGETELVDAYLDLQMWNNSLVSDLVWRESPQWDPGTPTRDYESEEPVLVNMVMSDSTVDYLRPGWFGGANIERSSVVFADGEFSSAAPISMASRGAAGGNGMTYYVGVDPMGLMTNVVDQLPPSHRLPEGTFGLYPARYRRPWHSRTTGWLRATNQPDAQVSLYNANLELYQGPALPEYVFDATMPAPSYQSTDSLNEFGDKLYNVIDANITLGARSDFTGQTTMLEFEVVSEYAISAPLETIAQVVDIEFFTMDEWAAAQATGGEFAVPARGTGVPHQSVLVGDNGVYDSYNDRAYHFLTYNSGGSGQAVQADYTRNDVPFFWESGLYVGTLKREGQPDLRISFRFQQSGGA